MVQPRTSTDIWAPFRPNNLSGLHFNLVGPHYYFIFYYYYFFFHQHCYLTRQFLWRSMNYLNWDINFMLGLSAAARFVTNLVDQIKLELSLISLHPGLLFLARKTH